IAAPASAASIAWAATSSGVSGRYGDMVGVWIDPVTAQVMMTLPVLRAIPFSLFYDWLEFKCASLDCSLRERSGRGHFLMPLSPLSSPQAGAERLSRGARWPLPN